jgi:hypothetical protein
MFTEEDFAGWYSADGRVHQADFQVNWDEHTAPAPTA